MMDDAGDVLRKLEPLFVYKCPRCGGSSRDPRLPTSDSRFDHLIDGSCESCGGQGIIFLSQEDITPRNLAKRGLKL